MPKYKLCPRCELNYIPEDEELCDVCKAQLNNSEDFFVEDEEEICPLCGQNLVEPGEKYCAECLEKRANGNISDDDSPETSIRLDKEELFSGDDDGDRPEIISLDDAIAEEDIEEDESYDDVDISYQEDLIDEEEPVDEEEALINEELKGEFADDDEIEEVDDEDIVEDDELEKEFKNIKIDENDFLQDDEEDEVEMRKKKLRESDDLD